MMESCEFIFTFSFQAESVMNSALLCLMSGKSNNNCGEKIPTGHRTHSEHQKGSLLQEEDSMSTSRQAIKLAQVYYYIVKIEFARSIELAVFKESFKHIFSPLGKLHSSA